MNNQHDSFPAAASILDLGLQLLNGLSNSLARMSDVYLSHNISHKACVTSACAYDNLSDIKSNRALAPVTNRKHAC
jgi:hypothetical protein